MLCHKHGRSFCAGPSPSRREGCLRSWQGVFELYFERNSPSGSDQPGNIEALESVYGLVDNEMGSECLGDNFARLPLLYCNRKSGRLFVTPDIAVYRKP